MKITDDDDGYAGFQMWANNTPMKWMLLLSETDSEKMKSLATTTELIKSKIEVETHMYPIPNVTILF